MNMRATVRWKSNFSRVSQGHNKISLLNLVVVGEPENGNNQVEKLPNRGKIYRNIGRLNPESSTSMIQALFCSVKNRCFLFNSFTTFEAGKESLANF
ncbi:MAG: hypothetical protein WCI18_17480 [Pseudomonadota bacterium]